MAKIKATKASALRQNLYLPLEVWSMIGEYIQGQRTILALIQTCRAFHDCFSPLLRRTFFLRLNKIPTPKLRRKFLPSGLQQTRLFEVLIDEFWGRTSDGCYGSTYDIKDNSLFASFVIRTLKEMSKLQVFRWTDSSFEERYGPSLILQTPEILRILKNTPTVQEISIVFGKEVLEDYTDACRCWIPLHGFKNLTALELYNFYGNFTVLSQDLVNVLADCPDLKVLGLGMQYDDQMEGIPDDLFDNYSIDFLETLCEDYGSRNGVFPLSLNTLRLGHGVFLYDIGPSSEREYLKKLVKLDTLESFHIYNGSSDYHDDDDGLMDLDCLQLMECRSLKQLSVTRFSEDIRDWLRLTGTSVKELIITDYYSLFEEHLDYFDLLENIHLSMLFIRNKVATEAQIQDWEERLDDPWSDNEARLDAGSVTVLDRLPDNGVHLTRLGLSLDLDRHWKPFLSRLAKLSQLVQLRIDNVRGRIGQFPRKTSSLWPGVESSDDIAYRYAKLIQAQCPSLRYILIGQCAWQVVHHHTESLLVDKDSSMVYLRPLDEDEIVAIELFALASHARQSGLLGHERRRYYSDEMLNDVVRIYKKHGMLESEL